MNLSQEALALRAGVSRRTIAHAEVSVKVSHKSARGIIEALGFDYMLDRDWIFPESGMCTLVVSYPRISVVSALEEDSVDVYARFGKSVLEDLARNKELYTPNAG